MAEVVSHYFPKLVDLHNYSAANSVSQKMYNWNTLNDKVFKKVSHNLYHNDICVVRLATVSYYPLIFAAVILA